MASNENPSTSEWRDYACELRSAPEGDGRTFEGYAAVWNSPTRISGWEGNFTETVARGAFKKTLAENKPILMFNHGKHPQVGDMPIGSITEAREDDRGLFIRARLFDNPLVEPVRQAIQGGAIKGMSFRFEPIKDHWNKARTERVLQEVRMPECGPVTFPAYLATTASVRSMGVAVRKIEERVASLTPADMAEMGDMLGDLAVQIAGIACDICETYGPGLDDQGGFGMNSAQDSNTEQREALDETEAARGTSGTAEPPAPEQKPAETTSAPSSKRDRLDAIARLKGIKE